jgi:hypothetical protein
MQCPAPPFLFACFVPVSNTSQLLRNAYNHYSYFKHIIKWNENEARFMVCMVVLKLLASFKTLKLGLKKGGVDIGNFSVQERQRQSLMSNNKKIK